MIFFIYFLLSTFSSMKSQLMIILLRNSTTYFSWTRELYCLHIIYRILYRSLNNDSLTFVNFGSIPSFKLLGLLEVVLKTVVHTHRIFYTSIYNYYCRFCTSNYNVNKNNIILVKITHLYNLVIGNGSIKFYLGKAKW